MTEQAARTGGLKWGGEVTLLGVARNRARGQNDQRKQHSERRHPVAVALILLGVLVVVSTAALGATWTTDIHGVSQDANGYDKRCDVYVNASGIPLATASDDIYIQVTDTSGGIVLSHDPIIFVVPNSAVTVTFDSKGNPFGAFTQQGPICPYAESTNGVYKVKVSAEDSFPPSNTFTDNFSVRLGDPGISKMCHTLDPGSVQQLAYTIEVFNYGGESLGVAVEDVLPGVLTNATYSLDGVPMGVWPLSNVVDLGTVDADAIHVIEIYVDVPADLTTIEPNTATVSSTSIDDTTGNNSSTCTNGITGITAIAVTKTVNPTSVSEPGGTVTFTVVVENTGNVVLTLTSLIDDIHGDLNGQGNISLPASIPVGGSFAGSFSATVSGNAGDVETDTVTATATGEGKTVSAEDSATVTITDTPSSIAVTKTANPTSVAEPGDIVTFTVIVENTSTVDNVTINSLIDNQFGDISGDCVPALPATLAPGETITCSFSEYVSGNAGETHTNIATASGTDDDGIPLEESDDAVVEFVGVRLSLDPPSDTNVVGDEHIFTATLEYTTDDIDWLPVVGATSTTPPPRTGSKSACRLTHPVTPTWSATSTSSPRRWSTPPTISIGSRLSVRRLTSPRPVVSARSAV